MSEVKRLSLDMEYPFQYREDAEGNLVYYSDYAALEVARDALAADNAALISAFRPKVIPTEATDNFSDTAVLRIDGDEFHSWQWVDNQDEVIRGVLDFFKPKTPATEAYLNSVRAEGIQMAIDNLKALDASPYAIHSLECKLHGLRAGEPS